MAADLSAGIAALALLLSIASPRALGQTLASPSAARVTGTITVIMNSTRVKHWGVPGADAAFVSDTDHSAYAARIRAASSASELCQALHSAGGKDPSIATASIDGDGSFEHRSGDMELMTFAVIVPHPAATPHGSLYVCSRPAFAMMSLGAYPDERFYQASDDHVLEWRSGPLTLHPGRSIPLSITWNVDPSRW